jgi:hypothetical protein
VPVAEYAQGTWPDAADKLAAQVGGWRNPS